MSFLRCNTAGNAGPLSELTLGRPLTKDPNPLLACFTCMLAKLVKLAVLVDCLDIYLQSSIKLVSLSIPYPQVLNGWHSSSPANRVVKRSCLSRTIPPPILPSTYDWTCVLLPTHHCCCCCSLCQHFIFWRPPPLSDMKKILHAINSTTLEVRDGWRGRRARLAARRSSPKKAGRVTAC